MHSFESANRSNLSRSARESCLFCVFVLVRLGIKNIKSANTGLLKECDQQHQVRPHEASAVDAYFRGRKLASDCREIVVQEFGLVSRRRGEDFAIRWIFRRGVVVFGVY